MCTYNKTTMNDSVFRFIYGCAMHDAILQKSFVGEKKWVGQVTEARTIVRAYIDRVLCGDFRKIDGATKDAHEKYFLETANAVCNAINTSPSKVANADVFSFGNAQKLINMTVKHVYAHTFSDPSLRECFRHCHCPLDSIMLAQVWKAYKNAFGGKKALDDLGTNVVFLAPWGKEGVERNAQAPLTDLPDRYAKFQNAINAIIANNAGDIFPIEYDYLVWKS